LKLENIIRAAASGVDTVRVVRTAMNPLLWLVGITVPLALVLGFLSADLLVRVFLLGFAAVIVTAAFAAYFVILIRDPDRLQSEEYRLQQRALQMLYKQGVSPEIVDPAQEIARMESLPGGSAEGGAP
jgi:hypothetical protein